MRKTLLALAAVFLLLAGSFTSAAAQATPSAQGSGASGGGVTPAGTAVTLVDNNDQPTATLTVSKFADPYTGFDPGSPPQRGFHFVSAEVALFAAGSATVTGNGYFYAVDADGFLYQQVYVNRPSANSQMGTFDSISASPGQVQTGIVFFQVLNNVKIVRIIYQPDNQRWLTVLDLRAAVTAPGTKVSTVDQNGQPMADVTVKSFVEPVKDFDPNNPPQRGFEFDGVTVDVANTGAAALNVGPNDFIAIDADGFAYNAGGVYRSANATAAAPDLQSASVDPGKTASGLVSFQVLKGSKINSVIYAPHNGNAQRFIEVANRGGKGVQSTATPGPQPTAANAATSGNAAGNASGNASGNAAGNASGNAAGNASGNTSAAAVPTPDLSGIDCNAVLTWAEKNIVSGLGALTATFTDLATWETDPTKIDSAKARADAKTVDDAVSNFDAGSAPSQIKPLADGYVSILKTYSATLKSLADHADAKDTAGIQADFAALNKAGDALSSPDLQALSKALDAACPDVANLAQ